MLSKKSRSICLFLATIILLGSSACRPKQCREADDNGDYVAADDIDINPINPDVIVDAYSDNSGVPIVNAKAAQKNGSYLRAGTTEAKARQNMWRSFKSSSGGDDIYVYQGRKIKTTISGAISLNGFTRTVTLPATVQSLTNQENNTSNNLYFIPMAHTDITLSGGSPIEISVTTPTVQVNDIANSVVNQIRNQKVTEDNVKDIAKNLKFPQNATSIKPDPPSINNVPLLNGLGVFAVIHKSQISPIYGNPDRWQCNTGFSSYNTRSGIRDDITACNNHYFFNGCLDVESGTGLCAGHGFTNATRDRLNTQVDGVQGFGDDTRQRYLFWVLRNHPAQLKDFMNAKRFGSLGLYYTGGRPQSSPAYGVSAGLQCNIRVSNPWSNINGFALCTHNRLINGWATSDPPPQGKGDYETARMPIIGTMSGWYFESGTCDQINKKYLISDTGSQYGGLITYGIANTDVFWGSPSTARRIGDCSTTICATESGIVTPTICSMPTLKTKWPIQFLETKLLVNDIDNTKPITIKNFVVENGIPQEKEQIVQSDLCSITLNKNNVNVGNIIRDATTLTQWQVIPNSLLTSTDSFRISATGRYDQSYKWLHTALVTAGRIYNEEYGKKPCSTAMAFAVRAIPFVSCFSGYQTRCSNDRITDLSRCIPTKNVLLPPATRSTAMPIGMCIKSTNGTEAIQKYSNELIPLPNTLQNTAGAFSSAEEIRIDHCGVCVKSNLPINPAGRSIVKNSDFSQTTNVGTAIQSESQCDATNGYQWLRSFSTESGEAISYSFRQHNTANKCNDNEDVKVANDPLVSLTSLLSNNKYGDMIYGSVGNIGANQNQSISKLSYIVPKEMKGSTISFGIAGNGRDYKKMFTSADQATNAGKAFSITVSAGKQALKGKYLFFYIQEFTRDGDGIYTQTVDTSKHPDTVFKDKTHNEIINMLQHDSKIQLYDFIALDAQDGDIDGKAIWTARASGKLWAIILDPGNNSIDPLTQDSDGRMIVFNDTNVAAIDRDNMATNTDLSNVISWNDGFYTVRLAAQTKGDVELGTEFIDDLIVGNIKQILYGKTTYQKDNCRVVLDSNAMNRRVVTPEQSKDNRQPIKWEPDKCQKNGIQKERKELPLTPPVASQNNITQYYRCAPISWINKCSYDLESNFSVTGLPTEITRRPMFTFESKDSNISDIIEMKSLTFSDIVDCGMRTGLMGKSRAQLAQLCADTFPNCFALTGKDNRILGGEFIDKRIGGGGHNNGKDILAIDTTNVCNLYTFYTQNEPILISYVRMLSWDGGTGKIGYNLHRLVNTATSCDGGSLSKLAPNDTTDTILQYWKNDPFFKTNDKAGMITSATETGLECTLIQNGQETNVKKAPKIKRYGDCQEICQDGSSACRNTDKSLRCTIYTFNSNNMDITGCITKDYKDSTCWLRTGEATSIPAPYNHIANNDFLPDNIMPSCDNNPDKPYKAYRNCRNEEDKRICNIARWCYPGQAGEFITQNVQVPVSQTDGNDNSTSSTTMQKIENCKTQYQDKIQYSNCSQVSSTLTRMCDVKEEKYRCTECAAPLINDTKYSLANIQAIGCNGKNLNRLYCGNNIYNACIAQKSGQYNNTIPALKFDNGSSTIEVCDQSAVVNSSSKRIEVPNYVFNGSDSNNFSPTSQICDVTTSCTWHNFDFKPNTNGGPLVGPTGGAFDFTKVVCQESRDWTSGLVYNVATSITKNLLVQTIFYVSFILWITLKGLKFINGQNIDLKTILNEFILIGVIFTLTSPGSWEMYQRIVVEALIDLSEGINNLIAGAVAGQYSQKASNGFGPVNMVINRIITNRVAWEKFSAILFSEWYGIIYFLVIVISIALYVLAITKAIIFYVSSIIMMSFYFCIGPICIMFALFDQTRSYFSAWLSNITRIIASQFGLFATIAIFSQLFVQVIEAIIFFKICFKVLLRVPFSNTTVFGWWRVSGSLPATFSYFLPDSAIATEVNGQFPSITIILVLIMIVMVMQKFVDSPIITGNAGFSDFFSQVSKGVGQAQGALKSLTIAKPTRLMIDAPSGLINRINNAVSQRDPKSNKDDSDSKKSTSKQPSDDKRYTNESEKPKQESNNPSMQNNRAEVEQNSARQSDFSNSGDIMSSIRENFDNNINTNEQTGTRENFDNNDNNISSNNQNMQSSNSQNNEGFGTGFGQKSIIDTDSPVKEQNNQLNNNKSMQNQNTQQDIEDTIETQDRAGVNNNVSKDPFESK